MARYRILEPYTRRVDDTRHTVTKLLLIGALIIFAMMLGFVIAILPMSMLIIPLTPLLLLAALALWMAPDIDPHLDGVVRKLFLLFMAIMVVWPDYIAPTIPGIGWVSFGRQAMAATALVSIYAIATSSRVRAHIADVVTGIKPLWWAFLLFVLLQLVLAVTTMTISSRWFFAQIFWYYMFIVAAWAFSMQGTTRRVYQIILIGLAIQCFYGLGEWIMQKPIWTDYIPPFMQVDPELLETVTSFTGRLGSDRGRIGSIYLTSLTYAEYIAITLPFVLHGILYARRKLWQLAAVALFAFVCVNAYLTDQRTAIIGIIMAVVLTTAFWSWRRFRQGQENRDMVGVAVIWMFPAMAMAVAAAVLFHPRVRTMTLGGGEHHWSNEARDIQWQMAIDRVLANPFGYGPFRAGEVVGFTNPSGKGTIDSFPINLLVDYGILGLILFTVFFAWAALVALRIYFSSRTETETLAGPIGIALIAFLVVKLVLSQTENHYLMYALAGCVAALYWKQQRRLAAEAVVAPAADPPAPARPPLGYGGGPVGWAR